MMRVFINVFAALAILAALPASAQTFPELSGRVVDQAGLLSSEQEAELTQLSAEIEAASTRQFVVATVNSLEDREIEDYGYRLGRAWGIGQGEANNGVILLVAPNERRVRIEVGYGLEPIVPDGFASDVINGTILPAFRDGDMAGGIVAGARQIGEQLRLPAEAAEARAAQLAAERAERRDRRSSILPVLFWIAVLLFILVPIIAGAAGGRKYRRGRAPVVIWGPTWTGGGSSGGSSWGGGGWGGGSGGGFGGGGFSGGGGSFGGGGASGGW